MNPDDNIGNGSLPPVAWTVIVFVAALCGFIYWALTAEPPVAEPSPTVPTITAEQPPTPIIEPTPVFNKSMVGRTIGQNAQGKDILFPELGKNLGVEPGERTANVGDYFDLEEAGMMIASIKEGEVVFFLKRGRDEDVTVVQEYGVIHGKGYDYTIQVKVSNISQDKKEISLTIDQNPLPPPR